MNLHNTNQNPNLHNLGDVRELCRPISNIHSCNASTLDPQDPRLSCCSLQVHPHSRRTTETSSTTLLNECQAAAGSSSLYLPNARRLLLQAKNK